MRKIIVSEFISLDGVVDSPGAGDHPEAGWTFKQVATDNEVYEDKGREQEKASALLMGRISYDEFAPVWPSLEEFAGYNAMPKYVVSATLENPEWHNTSVLRSLDDVRRLKDSDGGDIYVPGSPALVKSLSAAGLVDGYDLMIFPVLLGAGKRLFGADEGTPLSKLRLVEHKLYSNGVVHAVYDVER
ncbi:MAG: dihydrofolate reductase family protein [Rhodoglobus sp.]